MRNVEENIGMGDKKSNTKGVSPQRFKGGARRWYGAARGLAIILPFGLVLLPFMIMVSAYLPLAIVIGASLVGLAVPGRPHVGKSAWRTARESMVWILAALNIVVVGACFYFTTGFFGIALNSGFESAVKDASAFVEAFQKQFPSSEAEGGELYLSRLYGESNLPKDEAEWIGEHWWTDRVPEAGESVDGRMMIFCE